MKSTSRENSVDDKIYAGFFIRIISGLLDKLFFWLFVLMVFFIGGFLQYFSSSYFWLIQQISILIFHFIYNITIPQYFGGTLGKLVLKIKILKINFQKIGFRESALRYVINFVIWDLLYAIVIIISIINTPDELYSLFNTFLEWNNYLKINESKILFVAIILINAWILSEYFVLLLNKKKRGLQDYIAGTIIVNMKNYVATVNVPN